VRFLGVMASVMSASLTPENIMPVLSGSKAPRAGAPASKRLQYSRAGMVLPKSHPMAINLPIGVF
jgi:hypothetical protein